jgi:hypothetical protein
MTALLVLQNRLYRAFIFKNLDIGRSFEPDGVFPDDTASFEITITNRKLFPVTWLKLLQWFPNGIDLVDGEDVPPSSQSKYIHDMVISVMPFRRIKRTYRVKCRKRGYYRLIDDVTLVSTDALGTEEYTAKRKAPAYIAVFPRIVDFDARFNPADTFQGEFFVKRWIMEDPIAVSGIREYTYSESLRSINWKATAKSQALKVNKYDFTSDSKAVIFYYLPSYDCTVGILDEEEIESTISCAASIAVMMLNMGVPAGMVTNAHLITGTDSRCIHPGTGQALAMKILTAFSAITSYRKYGFTEVLEDIKELSDARTEVIIVPSACDEELLDGISKIHGMNITLLADSSVNAQYIPHGVNIVRFNGRSRANENS